MSRLNRRRLLRALAAAPVLAAPALWAREAAAQAGLITPQVCTLAPQTVEGPFYVDPGLVRSDITEGRAGVALDLALQVVTAGCVPIPAARVDVWHCDAGGLYSGVEGQVGATFLRGTQRADGRGVAAFRTIWPGWYPGRTAHLHIKVFLGDRTVLTGHVFLPDEISRRIYTQVAPYNARPVARATFNDRDSIARRAGAGAVAAVAPDGAGYRAALVIGVAG